MLVTNLQEWRCQVLQRDNYTCTKCGIKTKLHAHHKKSKTLFPELMLTQGQSVLPEHRGIGVYQIKNSPMAKKKGMSIISLVIVDTGCLKLFDSYS